MRRIPLTATVFVTLLGAGCVGELQPGPGDDGDDDPLPVEKTLGRQNYDTNVAAVMANCASCHQTGGTGTAFLGAGGVTDDYDTLTGTGFRTIIGDFNPAQAPLIIYGSSEAHTGTDLTAAQAAIVETWLVQEAMDRDIDISGEPPPGPVGTVSSRQALAKFAACMSFGDWNTDIGNVSMGDWNNKGSNGGDCSNCHAASGAGGFYTDNSSQAMFDMNRTELFMRAFFTTKPVDPTSPTSDFMVVPNMPKLIAKGSGAGGNHPNYNTNANDVYFLRLTAFYDATQARLATCTAPAVFPTPP